MFRDFTKPLDPQVVETLARAFEAACLRFAEKHDGAFPNDTISNGIAARMIQCAEAGEGDANRLIDFGLDSTYNIIT